MAGKEKTSKGVARKASEVLRDPSSSKTEKRLAGSALSQVDRDKKTSPAVAKTAGKTLEAGRSSQTAKRLAGSVLTQKQRGKK